MTLTRRGWAVVGVITVSLLMAWLYGARSLNAIVAPAVVALGAGVVALWRAPAPSATRSKPAPGFPGERRSVVLSVETSSHAEVRDEATGGLRLVGATDAVAGADDLQYEVELRRRGVQELGPTRVTVRDVLGLFAVEHTVGGRTPALVYPDVQPIAAPRAFDRLVDVSGTTERQAFDRLREYVPGDALRDVHWKSSAKRADDDLVVTEFTAEDRGGVTVVAEGDAGHADAMADAAASVALYLLDADVRVSLTCPGGTVESATGEEGRDLVLDMLARTPGGRVRTDVSAAADVHVAADDDGVTVTIDGDPYAFADLVATAESSGRVAGEVVA